MKPATLAFSLLLLGLAGCGGYSARLTRTRTALDAGAPRQALRELNRELKVKRAEDLPAPLKGEGVLLALERGTVLQQLGRYPLSSRDLEAADKGIEMLDFSRSGIHEVGRYLFSDDVGPYRAPAYEKLMINTLNMVNYLARGDLSGARVEARRFAVMQRFLRDHEEQGVALSGAGSHLAGFAFERSGQNDEALRFYREAAQYRETPSLRDAIERLSGKKQAQGPCAQTENCGELLVVFSLGRVPPKRARRMPIGLALTYASPFLSPYDYRRANRIAAQGLVTWVNSPELGMPRGSYESPWLALNGQALASEEALQVDVEARRAWERIRGPVIASALVRTISRALIGEASRQAAGGGWAGLLLSLGSQAALTARDTPDTRSWSTLPARIYLSRLRLPPGDYVLEGAARGLRGRRRVHLEAGGWALVSFSALR